MDRGRSRTAHGIRSTRIRDNPPAHRSFPETTAAGRASGSSAAQRSPGQFAAKSPARDRSTSYPASRSLPPGLESQALAGVHHHARRASADCPERRVPSAARDRDTAGFPWSGSPQPLVAERSADVPACRRCRSSLRNAGSSTETSRCCTSPHPTTSRRASSCSSSHCASPPRGMCHTSPEPSADHLDSQTGHTRSSPGATAYTPALGFPPGPHLPQTAVAHARSSPPPGTRPSPSLPRPSPRRAHHGSPRTQARPCPRHACSCARCPRGSSRIQRSPAGPAPPTPPCAPPSPDDPRSPPSSPKRKLSAPSDPTGSSRTAPGAALPAAPPRPFADAQSGSRPPRQEADFQASASAAPKHGRPCGRWIERTQASQRSSICFNTSARTET